MKIFYAGVKYANYDPERGTSFEHNNFYLSLSMFPGAEVHYFPFERIFEVGKKEYNSELLRAVKNERPDILFVFMAYDELDKQVLEEIKKYTVSLAWFADDSWRFWNYSRFWAKYFTWAVTTYSWTPELYKKGGQPSVWRSQWAANTDIYKPAGAAHAGPGVSFVGSWSRPRERIVSYLRKSGINVFVYGGGWLEGRASEEKMVQVFSTSKINLGLNPPPGRWSADSLGRVFLRRSIDGIVPDFHLFSNFKSWLHRGVPQIKARHFEIPACGGFLLTSMADDLDKFFKIGEEIVVYENAADLVEKIRYYLAHKEEREKIARAGYERVLREHTYGRRFEELFKGVGVIS